MGLLFSNYVCLWDRSFRLQRDRRKGERIQMRKRMAGPGPLAAPRSLVQPGGAGAGSQGGGVAGFLGGESGIRVPTLRKVSTVSAALKGINYQPWGSDYVRPQFHPPRAEGSPGQGGGARHGQAFPGIGPSPAPMNRRASEGMNELCAHVCVRRHSPFTVETIFSLCFSRGFCDL